MTDRSHNSPARQHLLAALHWAEMTVRASLLRQAGKLDRGAVQLDRQRAVANQRLRRVESGHSDLPMQRLRARWQLELFDEQVLWCAVGAATDRRIDALVGQFESDLAPDQKLGRTPGRTPGRIPGQVPRFLLSELFCDNRAQAIQAHGRLLLSGPLATADLLAVSADGGHIAATRYAIAMLAGGEIPGVHGPGTFALDRDADRHSSAMLHRYRAIRPRAEVTLDSAQWTLLGQLVERERARGQTDDLAVERAAPLCLLSSSEHDDIRRLAEVMATAVDLPICATSLARFLDGAPAKALAHLEAVVAQAAEYRSVLVVEHAHWLIDQSNQVAGLPLYLPCLNALTRHRGPVVLLDDSDRPPDALDSSLEDQLTCHLRPTPAAG